MGTDNKVINEIMKQKKLSYQEAEKLFNSLSLKEKEDWNKIAGGSRGGNRPLADAKMVREKKSTGTGTL